MAVSVVRIFLFANVLIVLALALVLILRALSARLRWPIAYRQQLLLGYALILAAILGSWVALSPHRADFLPTTTQVWSAPSMNLASASAADRPSAIVTVGAMDTSVPLDLLTQGIVVACAAGLLFALFRILAGVRSARAVVRRAHVIRRSGTLRILAVDEPCVPFSFWIPGSHYIVVPASLITRPRDLRIALRHEAQHHRHGDTRVVYAIEFLRGAFFLNPAVHVLLRLIGELQEFACDEALVGRREVTARAYCDCLMWVAQSSIRARRVASCMRMADPEGTTMLARRIAAVLGKPRQYLRRSTVVAMNALAVMAIVATGIGISGSVQDRRVSLAQAQEMAAAARSGSGFPIVVNEQVVSELNRLLGTPDGRAFMRASLRRMDAHKELIATQLERHGLPQELLAVPIAESGYRNLPQSGNPQHGAGIWMFIKPTARRFGLTVDERKDERLDVASETDAAVQYFSSLYSEFNDWGFAVLAYNGGRRLAQRAIRDTGSRDAFWAAQHGYEHDRGYLPRVMAAVIVLKNAHLLQADQGASL